MEATLDSAMDPKDLVSVSDANLPYRFDQIFRAEGFGAKRLEKNRLKLMKAIDPVVQRLLADGERVQFVTWGTEYSLIEHLIMGVWAFLINRRALVLTDRRILLLQIDSRQRALDLKAQLRYQAIEKRARHAFGQVIFLLRNRKKLVINGMPGRDRKVVKAFVEEKLAETRADAPALGIENLCPRCGHRVRGFPERCNQCPQAFKSGRRAGWLSLAFPGLGDLYLGHRWLGTFEILGTLVAWFVVPLPFAWAAFTEGSSWAIPATAAGLVFTFAHGLDAWITRRVGLKGIYPADP
ncbi:MAG TPA: hypothetical protein ENI85_10455 [Deltaproteobacteria bacterium]|nr:hypothetical protein [Deltaproteobacteria bacterium]